MQVTSGAVDLSTGKFEVPGSTSQVAFADAVATLNEESRAVVRNDPGTDIHEITVDQGVADVTRGSRAFSLANMSRFRLRTQQAGMIRNKVIAPPNLVAPQNMELKLVKEPKAAVLEFSWTEVARGEILPSADFSLGDALQFCRGQEDLRADCGSRSPAWRKEIIIGLLPPLTRRAWKANRARPTG